MRQVAFVLAGLASGFFSGALGLGGAALATPLIRFLGVAPFLAIGTTVPAILPSTLTGALTYRRAGLIDRRVVSVVAPVGAVSALAGALLTREVPGRGHLLMIATSAVILFLSARILKERPHQEPHGRPSWIGLALTGLIGGGLSGLLGVGGGFVIVPIFIRRFGLPIKVALGTSLAVITLTVIPNLIGQTLAGNVDWLVAGLLALGVVPGALIGARVAIAAREPRLRLALGISLIVVSVSYAAFEISALIKLAEISS